MARPKVFRAVLSAILILLLLGEWIVPVAVLAGPSVGAPEVSPSAIPVSQAVTLTVTSAISSAPGEPPPPVTACVELLRVDGSSRVLGRIGYMRDDGVDGDATAGDGIYTLRFTTVEPLLGELRLRVSVPFQGMVRRVLSPITAVPITANLPPVFTSTPLTTALEAHLYYYQPVVQDPEGEPLTFELVQKPAGMTLAPNGFMSWTPTTSQIGDHTVTVRVTDPEGASATQTWTLRVQDFNEPPQITSIPLRHARIGEAYAYQVTAFDPELAAIAFSFGNAPPSGMTIDAATGIIAWTPPAGSKGAFEVTVRATDAGGASATQTYTLDVVEESLDLISPTGAFPMIVGETLELTLVANYAKAGFVVTPLPRNASLQGNVFRFTPSADQEGIFNLGFEAVFAGMRDVNPVQLAVARQNRPPVIEPLGPFTVDEGKELAFVVSATDPDGDALRPSAPGLALENAFFNEITQQFVFRPSFQQAGTYQVAFQVSDGRASSQVTATINVQDVAPPAQALDLVVDPLQNPTFQSQLTISGSIAGQVSPALPPPAALVTGLSPTSVRQGRRVTVDITGFRTNFQPRVVTATFGSGITVESLQILSPTQARATILAAANAPLGVHQVRLLQAGQEIPSVVAFLVEPGASVITGVLVDSFTGQPLAGARVAVNGSNLSAITDAQGRFSLDDVTPGEQTLVITLPNYEVKVLNLAIAPTQVIELETAVGLQALARPASPGGSLPRAATVASVLDRGVTSKDGGLSLDQAKAVVTDTILAIAGDTAGVLDEAGRQLNPRLLGNGYFSLTPLAVELHALRLMHGEVYTFRDVIGSLRGTFGWVAPQLSLDDALGRLQGTVNAAWADPGVPTSAVPIVLFNEGVVLSPRPPTLTADTRLNHLQAFLLVVSFLIQHLPQLNRVFDAHLRSRGIDPAQVIRDAGLDPVIFAALEPVPTGTAQGGIGPRLASVLTSWARVVVESLGPGAAYAAPAPPNTALQPSRRSVWDIFGTQGFDIFLSAGKGALIAGAAAVLIAFLGAFSAGSFLLVTAGAIFLGAFASSFIAAFLIKMAAAYFTDPTLPARLTPAAPQPLTAGKTQDGQPKVFIQFRRADADLAKDAARLSGRPPSGFAEDAFTYLDGAVDPLLLDYRYHLWKFDAPDTEDIRRSDGFLHGEIQRGLPLSTEALPVRGQPELLQFRIPLALLRQGDNYFRIKTIQFYRRLFNQDPDQANLTLVYRDLDAVPPPPAPSPVQEWLQQALQIQVKASDDRIQAFVLQQSAVLQQRLSGVEGQLDPHTGTVVAESTKDVDLQNELRRLELEKGTLEAQRKALVDARKVQANQDTVAGILRYLGTNNNLERANDDLVAELADRQTAVGQELYRAANLSSDPANAVAEAVSLLKREQELRGAEKTRKAYQQADGLIRDARSRLTDALAQANTAGSPVPLGGVVEVPTALGGLPPLPPPERIELPLEVRPGDSLDSIFGMLDDAARRVDASIPSMDNLIEGVDGFRARALAARDTLRRLFFDPDVLEQVTNDLEGKKRAYRLTRQNIQASNELRDSKLKSQHLGAGPTGHLSPARLRASVGRKVLGASKTIGREILGNAFDIGEAWWDIRDGIDILSSPFSAVFTVRRTGDIVDVPPVQTASAPVEPEMRYVAKLDSEGPLDPWELVRVALQQAAPPDASEFGGPRGFPAHFESDPDAEGFLGILRPAGPPPDNPKAGFLVRDYPFSLPEAEVFEAGFPSELIAVDSGGAVYLNNFNSNNQFGGRMFRYFGNPIQREHIGSINYYSQDLGLARPALPVAMEIGDYSDPVHGRVENLFVANQDAPVFFDPGLTPRNRILRVPIHLADLDPAFANGQNRHRLVGQPYAEHPDFTFAGPSDLEVDTREPSTFAGGVRPLYLSDGPAIYVIADTDGNGEGEVRKIINVPGRIWSGLAQDSHGNLFFADFAQGEVFLLPAAELDSLSSGQAAPIVSDPELDQRAYLIKVGLSEPGDVELDTFEQRYLVSTADGLLPFDIPTLGRFSDNVVEIRADIIGREVAVTLRPTRGRVFMAGANSEGFLGKSLRLRLKYVDPNTGAAFWRAETAALRVLGATVLPTPF